MNNRIVNIIGRFNPVGQIPTYYFIICYIAIIPIFATIYYYLPDRSFYHTTSKYEYGDLGSDADYILHDFRESLIFSNLGKSRDSILRIKGWSLNLNHIIVQSLNVAEFPKSIDFNLFIQFIHDDGSRVGLPSTARIQLQNTVTIGEDIKCPASYDLFPDFPYSVLQPGLSSFFKISNDSLDLGFSALIDFKPDLWNNIISFGQAYRGFPNRFIKGHWSRMLYLSAGVATSTLIGDIIPITKTSRFCITFQGILSILVIGLFINSVGNDIFNSNHKRKKVIHRQVRRRTNRLKTTFKRG